MNTQHCLVSSDGVYLGPEVWKGDLTLRSWDYDKTLTSLGCLREVTGILIAGGFNKLEDLGNLTTVGRYLDLEGCHNLKTLGNVTTVGGALDIENCHNLISLGNVTTIKSHLHIIGCDKLTSIGNLNHIGETVSLVDRYKCRTRLPGGQFLERAKYYQEIPLHEALNAIHFDEVQDVILYKNILLNKLQGV